ncbi:MAG: methionyl-tRNA formyltransferase [Parcubacteria group bacterium]|nr:methionyl-tRNA formyltransferase [Parcubacteria group bacterium]
MQNSKIIFWGTDNFSIPILDSLIKSGYQILAIITTPDKPTGRKQTFTPPLLKSWIIKHESWDIEILQPEKLTNDLRFKFQDLRPDLCIVASYGKIIPKEILEIPKFGFINVHPSLLPKYRGPTPIQTSILNGETQTGVTIMLVDELMDHGPTIVKHKTWIMEHDTYELLHDKLAKIGAELLIKTIPKWVKNEIKPVEQDHTQATFTKKFSREDGHLDFLKPAEYLDRQIRALNPEPGTWITTKSKVKNQKAKDSDKKEIIIKIIQAESDNEESGLLVGTVFKNSKGQIAVQCKIGSLVLLSLQKGGGKISSIQEFVNGHKYFIGSRLNTT